MSVVLFKLGEMDYTSPHCYECYAIKHRTDQEIIDEWFPPSADPMTQKGQITALLFDVTKPCPFCGRLEGLVLMVRKGGTGFSIHCPMCCMGPMSAVPKGAVEAWNKRGEKDQ